MTRRRLAPGGLPLALVASGATVSGAFLAVAVTGVALAVTHRLDSVTAVVLTAATVLGLVPAVLTWFVAGRVSIGLRRLNAEAVHRLREPGTPSTHLASRQREVFAPSAELADLVRMIGALQARVRVSDELADRQRHTAETASAGMYELLSGLVAAEEATRGQLAAELHDTVAQSLMLARTLLADALTQVADAPVQLERAVDYVAEAEEQVRAVMARTRPPALRDGDLARAVGMLRDDMFSRYGLTVRMVWPMEAYPLALVSAITVYRFFQEALLNVVKHAEGDEAAVTLDVDEHQLVATVTDDGPGFDPSLVRPDKGRHVGLGLLRERARLAGGGLEVDSMPGGATTLTLRLPRTGTPTAGGVRASDGVRTRELVEP